MKIYVHRFANNPLLAPENLRPSRPDFEVTCVLNPGAFRFGNRIGLLLRVAERPVPETGSLATPVLREDGTITVLRVRRDDPGLSCVEARSFVWNGRFLLTTMSHLLPAWSDDGGRTFVPDYNCRLFPALAARAVDRPALNRGKKAEWLPKRRPFRLFSAPKKFINSLSKTYRRNRP